VTTRSRAALGNDTIDPGPGDDVVTDAAGDETYRFAPGDGRVQITDLAGTDRLEFAAGIAATDVSVTQRDGADIILRFAGSEDRVELLGALNDTSNRIEEIAFDGGPTWTYADLIALLNAGDATAQVLVGSPDGDTIDGGDGDDDIDGAFGDDDLSGGAGSDTVAGGEGNDTLTGGTGADELLGGPGDDVYRYAAGDGQVSITDTDGVETIEIGPGLLPGTSRSLPRAGLTLSCGLTGTEDRLILKNVLTDPVRCHRKRSLRRQYDMDPCRSARLRGRQCRRRRCGNGHRGCRHDRHRIGRRPDRRPRRRGRHRCGPRQRHDGGRHGK
jgi:hypothetical protein